MAHRAPPSGIALDENDAAIVKGMLARGDRQHDVAAWFGSNPTVPKACEGNALLGPEGCKTNGIENFDKIAFWRTPEAKCKSSPEGCVPYSKWVTDYVAVMGGN